MLIVVFICVFLRFYGQNTYLVFLLKYLLFKYSMFMIIAFRITGVFTRKMKIFMYYADYMISEMGGGTIMENIVVADAITANRVARFNSQKLQGFEFENRNLLEQLSIQIRWLKEWKIREGYAGNYVFPYTSIWLVIEGTATIISDQIEYTIRKGDIVCIPPQTSQSWKSVDDSQPLHYYAFALEAKIGLLDFIRLYRFPRLASAIDPEDFKELLQSWQSIAQHCTSLVESVDEVELRRGQHTKLDTNQTIRYLKMQTLGLSWMLKLYETMHSYLPDQPVLYDQRISQICDYVSTHLSEPIMLDDLAERIGLGKEQFRSLFQQTHGTSPMKYVQLLRMQRAKELLTLTVCPIKDISVQVGFENQHHFSNAFRKYTGISPLEYRRQHLEVYKESMY